jgi:hypothetical protein
MEMGSPGKEDHTLSLYQAKETRCNGVLFPRRAQFASLKYDFKPHRCNYNGSVMLRIARPCNRVIRSSFLFLSFLFLDGRSLFPSATLLMDV